MKVIAGYQDIKVMLSGAPIWQTPRWKCLVDKKRKKQKQIMRVEEKKNDLSKMINQDQTNMNIQSMQLEENNNYYNESIALLLKNIDPSSDVSITLLCGIQVSENGIVKLIPALNHVNFGQYPGNSQKIQIINQLGVVDIQRTYENNIQALRNIEENRASLEIAINILNKLPSQINQQIIIELQYYSKLLEQRQELSGPAPHVFKEGFVEGKDNEYQEFIRYCFEVIRNLPQGHMYSYNIGRSHPVTDQIDTIHSGYSQEYLDLLGIDNDALCGLILRKKTTEIVQDNNDINKLSGSILQWMRDCKFNVFLDQEEFKKVKNQQEEYKEFVSEFVSSQITTFDGFNLMLAQRLRTMFAPMNCYFQAGKLADYSCGYVLQIFEFDVDLRELEDLISYRQRLSTQSDQLSLQDYMRRELSLMFEDVEYSVRSQEFLERYYGDTLPNLKRIKVSKEDMEIEERSRCKYKNVKS